VDGKNNGPALIFLSAKQTSIEMSLEDKPGDRDDAVEVLGGVAASRRCNAALDVAPRG